MKPFITIKEIRQLLAEKKISPSELRAFYSARIKTHNPTLNCVLGEEDAAASESATGTLAGIPFLRKDNISRTGYTTSAGSAVLKPYKSPYTATVIKNLEAQGATCLGRANMDEFAMGSTGEFSAYGPTKNPWDLSASPGGSSSGSAAAVAAGLAPFALGTETGGSVRAPSAFCNLVGLYPTYCLNSRFGVIAFASSNDQVGAFTKTVYDNALVQSALGGQDKNDAISIQQGAVDYTQGLDGKLPAGLRVGVLKDSFNDGVDEEVKAAFSRSVEHMQKLGATVTEIEIPSWKHGIAIYFIISRAEAASNLARFDGSLYGARSSEHHSLKEMYELTRQHGFGTEIKRRILVGNYVLTAGHKDAFYGQACRVRSMIKAEFDALFKNIDVMMAPTAPTLPFKLGSMTDDPFKAYMADYFVLPSNMIGTPALAVPAGFSKTGLPIGIQFFGQRLSEQLLYKVGHAYEQATGYYLQNPGGFA